MAFAAAALPYLMAGAAVMGTVASVQAAKANADNANMEADSIATGAAYDERQQRRQLGLMRGQANAQAAASGVDITSGSPLLLELDRVKQSELEALNTRRSGQIGVTSKRFQAEMYKQSIPYLIAGGAAQGGSSILSSYVRTPRP